MQYKKLENQIQQHFNDRVFCFIDSKKEFINIRIHRIKETKTKPDKDCELEIKANICKVNKETIEATTKNPLKDIDLSKQEIIKLIYTAIDIIIQNFNHQKIIIEFENFYFPVFCFDFETIKLKNSNDIGLLFYKCSFDDSCWLLSRTRNYKILLGFEDSIFKEYFWLENCQFKNISFKKCIFEKEFRLESCVIKNKADFSNVKFMDNAYFNNTKFLDYADFHEAEFEAVACFYGAKFEKPMNFSSAILKDFNKADFVNLNIENINLENIKTAVEENYKDESYKKEICDKIKEYKPKIKTNLKEYKQNKQTIETQYKKEKETIEAQYKKIFDKFREYEQKIKTNLKEYKQNKQTIKAQYKKEKETIDFKYKIRWANNFRDSFRVIKHSLIETNNNLEASNFHKLELYAKEIELKNKILNNPDNLQDNVEYWQLGIYKNTSEHHTSLVTILNFTMAIISLWSIMLLYVNFSFDTLRNYEFMTDMVVFVLIACISYNFRKFITTRITTFIILMASIALLFFILDYLLITNSSILVLFILIYMFVLSEFYIFFIKHNNISKNKNYTILFSFLFFILVLISNPHIIIPLDKFSQNNSNKCLETKLSQANKTEIINLASIINQEFNATKNPNLVENFNISELNEYKKFIVENKEILKDSNATNAKFKQAIYADSSRDKTIKCISFIYAIILGLCLFSLQKTARRNSVVPS